MGGRSFGAILLWLLLAGEIYTTFTFLKAAGWAYSRVAPAFYILCYGTIAYLISYFLLPPIWEIAKARGLLTGPDFFAGMLKSEADQMRATRVLVLIVGALALIFWLFARTSLAGLLPIGYNGVTQFFPGDRDGAYLAARYCYRGRRRHRRRCDRKSLQRRQ